MKMKFLNKILFLLIATLLLLNFIVTNTAFAVECSSVYGISDYNCDGKVSLFFMGDSIVYGFGDEINKNKGGYILRLKKTLSRAEVNSYGVQGLRTAELLSTLKLVFSTNEYPDFKTHLLAADAIILDIARNDFWTWATPEASWKRIKLIRSLIIRKVKQATGLEPIVVISNLLLPNRTSQGAWVQSFNALALSESSDRFPSDIRLDKISKKLLSKDGLHPTSKGYKAVSNAMLDYAKTTLVSHMSINRPDLNLNNIPDLFE